jgi:formate hydrogenlyase subunit 3/multisubunit Na+/H+ antiporter MnhD subunit
MDQADSIAGVLAMDNYLLILPALIPFALSFLLIINNKKVRYLMILAPLTALVVALTVAVDSSAYLPWLLLGVTLQLDETARLFLLFSSIIWMAASLFIVIPGRIQKVTRVYCALFLIAMSGNFLLIMAADMVSFYLGFALMGLSTYGLIIKPSQQARRAARVYLGFTLVGEMALFSAILLLFNSTGSLLFTDLSNQALPDLAVALLLLGFGIKLALPGLHPWLPLVYTSAPIVSVAVLSGPMMKAGLLGWIRFLPGGTDAMISWGQLLIWLGVGGLLLGSVLALLQRTSSAVLAYSSVAKMGLVSAIFGYALAHPQQMDLVITALVLFAMHHLLVKSALFLGLGAYLENQSLRPWILTGLVLLALSLAGLPFSGGLGAKLQLDITSQGELGWLLKLSGFATSLMMLHFLTLVVQQNRKVSAMTYDNSVSIKPVLAWFLLLPVAWWGPFMPGAIDIDSSAFLITVLAIAIYLWFSRAFLKPARLASFLKPGDIYHLCKRIRFIKPVLVKTDQPVGLYLSAPQIRHPGKFQLPSPLSLTIPGFRWLVVIALLMSSLLLLIE